ncbi:retrovirus-related pol polyprotein from transposon TNT 1-94 [Tanacetum coccineum]
MRYINLTQIDIPFRKSQAVRCTRPDVAFAQNITSHFQQNSGEAHWTVVKNILKYLRNTKDTFLVYGGNPEVELRVNCYCDAGFETDRDDTKSQTRKFIDELGVVPLNNYPIKMNCDNSAAIIMAKESGIQKGARHFKRKYHYVRECIETGKIDIVKVHTDDNLADPFTKALAGPKLTRHARSMGLRPASSFRSYIPYKGLYRDRRLSILEEALGAFGKSQTYSAEDKYRGRGYNRGQEAEQKQVEIIEDIREIKYRQNITCWNCNQKGHFQNQCSKLVASRDKVVNMAARDSDDALVCCVKNTVEDRIMDSGASFYATYCKEELDRIRLRSGKVRLADDKTLDIASIGDVVLKTSFGTSWTLKDVSYIPGLKRRLISVGQLDEEGYHVGFGDQQWKVTKCSLVVAHGKKVEACIWLRWFGEAEESFLHNVSEDKEIAEIAAGVTFGVAERLSRTFRAESTGLCAEAPKMLWADSVSTAYLIYRIPYILIGLRIPKEEWRGKDTSLTHLKSSEITQSLGGSSDTSEGSKNNRSFEDSGRSYEEYSEYGASCKEGGSETPQVRRSTREFRAPVRYSSSANYLLLIENEPDVFLSQITSRKEGITKLVDVQGSKRAGWQEKLQEPSYMEALNDTSTQHKSEGFQLAGQEENLECKLKEILYRLIQAPRLRYLKFDSFMQKDKNEEPCRDVHQVGDEREVEALSSLNLPPRLLMNGGVQRLYNMLRHVSLEGRHIVVLGLRGGLLGANPIPHRLARGVQFSTGRAVWHEPEQFSSELNNISLV